MFYISFSSFGLLVFYHIIWGCCDRFTAHDTVQPFPLSTQRQLHPVWLAARLPAVWCCIKTSLKFTTIICTRYGGPTCSRFFFCGLWLAFRVRGCSALVDGRGFTRLHFLWALCIWKKKEGEVILEPGVDPSEKIMLWAAWRTRLFLCMLFGGLDDFLLSRGVVLAALFRAGAVLGLGFVLGLGKLGFVEQVVDFAVQQGQLGLYVFGQQDGPLLRGAFLLFCHRLVLPRLREKRLETWSMTIHRTRLSEPQRLLTKSMNTWLNNNGVISYLHYTGASREIVIL